MDDAQDCSPRYERRENALQHGLTAQRLIPKILQPGRDEELKRQFRQEYSPATVAGEIYLAEAARHAGCLRSLKRPSRRS
jgi:hypothetical protein